MSSIVTGVSFEHGGSSMSFLECGSSFTKSTAGNALTPHGHSDYPDNSCPALTPSHSTTTESCSVEDISHAQPRCQPSIEIASRQRREQGVTEPVNFADRYPQYDGHDRALPDSIGAAANLVCYGLLPQVKVRLEANPHLVSSTRSSRNSHIVFSVASNKNYYYLSAENSGSETRHNFAFISLRVCSVMQELKDYGVQYAAHLLADEWTKIISAWKPNARSQNRDFDVDLLLNGPEINATQVGNLYSDVKLFLQQPSPALADQPLRLVNPHWLELDRLSTSLQRPEPMGQMLVKATAPSLRTVLESSYEGESLEQASIDPRVLTELYPHQRLAVDFMLKKENRSLPKSMTLWEKRQTPGGHVYYKHKITGKRVTDPWNTEVRGGILADEMGGGKTVSLLAVIIATLDETRHSCRYSRTSAVAPHAELPICPATLVVLPSELMLASWEAEIRQHINPDTLRIHRFHGPGKEIDPARLAHVDLVLTTYATVESDSRANSHKCLQAVCWYRMVLDEAHLVRSDTTKQHTSVREIHALRRWCLTGTIVQNRLEDLGSILQFLQLPQLNDRATFRKHIIAPIETRQDTTNLQEKLLPSIYLRRRRKAFHVQDPNEETKWLHLSKKERDRYEQIERVCGEAVQVAKQHQSHGENRRSRLRQSLRLRIACNNGSFERVPPSALLDDPFSLRDTERSATSNLQCPACTEGAWNLLESKTSQYNVCGGCAAGLCKQHIPEYAVSVALNCSAASKRCRYCNKSFKPPVYEGAAAASHFDQLTDHDIDTNTSTKLEAIMQDIIAHSDTRNSLVFSSWRTTLELLRRLLKHKNIEAKFIHGQTAVSERTSILNSFEGQGTGQVLLMTLGTGGVGLNIFSANRIHLVEPQWNPASEEQACSRAVRLGQARKVTVIRYIMENTVETEAVQPKQKRKRELADPFN